jgi:hypothetical protein
MSPMKEPHFYSEVVPKGKFAGIMPVVRDPDKYVGLFSGGAKYPWRCDASTSYLWSPVAARRLQAEVSDAHIVIVLRNPVERAFSHYLNDVREGVEQRSFFEAIREDWAAVPKGWGVTHLYVDLGFYGEQLERYLTLFGLRRTRVLFLEDLWSQPDLWVKELAALLREDASTLGSTPFAQSNPFGRARNAIVRKMLGSGLARRLYRAVIPRTVRERIRSDILFRRVERPRVDPEAVQWLREIYKDEDDAVERLMGRKPPWAPGASSACVSAAPCNRS